MKNSFEQKNIHVIDPSPLSSEMRDRISKAKVSDRGGINPFDERWFMSTPGSGLSYINNGREPDCDNRVQPPTDAMRRATTKGND
jgi:hypothetical protein